MAEPQVNSLIPAPEAVFVNVGDIAPKAPVVVVLVTMAECPACEEFWPVFLKAAQPFAQRGLPIVHVDAMSEDPEEVRFMEKHQVNATPTVIVASYLRAPIAKLEGVSTIFEVTRLLHVAWAHNRPPRGLF